MEFKKQLGNSLVALLLFVALLLPTAVQFFHMFEGHEHSTYTDKTPHIHESVADCELCDFHLASANYTIAQYPDLLPSKIPITVDTSFIFLKFHSLTIPYTQLRAPPIFS